MSIKNEPVPRDLHNAAMARRDARIAELTAEVARLRGTLTEIVKSPWQGSCDYVKGIARNALKEGV